MQIQEKTIYLDNNATTQVDEKVLEQMLPYFTNHYGNAASRTHQQGWNALAAVDLAREQTANLLGCAPDEIIFTSGATEAINLALKGVFEAYSVKGNHFVISKTEHKAVIDTCNGLEKKGAIITWLNVDAEGNISLTELEKSITDKTILVSVMLANNETGVIQPIAEIAEIVHRKKTLLFCDTTQAAGKWNFNVDEDGIDLCCISAHKLHGPKGCGALYIRRKNPRVTLTSQIDGGGHERGLRSGTLNVPGIVGLGKACELAKNNMWDENTNISKLRAKLEHQLLDLPGLRINGGTRNRLYNTSNICFEGKNAVDIIKALKDVAASIGSACSSANPEPSHVLTAMGISGEDIKSSIRFSLSKYNTEAEIDSVIELIKKYYSTK